MKKCLNCNISYADDKKFCKNCGSSLESIQKLDPKQAARKEVLEEKLKADPLNEGLLKEYAGFLSDQSLYNEAITAALKVLAINENESGIKDVLFHAYAGLESWDTAIETGEEILSKKSDDVAFLYQLAVCYHETGKLDKANSLYDAVLKIEPNLDMALYNKALALLGNNHLQEAASIFGKLKMSGKDDEMTIIYAGIDKVIKQEYEAAVNMLKPVLSDELMTAEYAGHSRGFMALAYAHMNTDASFSGIRKWFWRIDLSALKENYNAQDEEWYVGIASHLLDYELEHFSATTEFAGIKKFREIATAYIKRQESYLTDRTRTIRAQMWHQLALKQQQMQCFADALDSLEKAAALDPEDSQHSDKIEEVEKLHEKQKIQKKRKAVIIGGSVLTIILLIILSVNLYNRNKENNAWGIAKQENTYEAYMWYQNKFPYSKYTSDAKLKIDSIRNAGILVLGEKGKDAVNENHRKMINEIPGRFPKASNRLLTESELRSMNKHDLRIMRNEIFARHGYIFNTAEMKAYFSTQPWYRPRYSDVNRFLSDVEKINIEKIRSFE